MLPAMAHSTASLTTIVLGQFVCRSVLESNPPFHWTAIPLRFEILVKMTRIVAETARAQ